MDRQVYYRSLQRNTVRISKAQQVLALVEEKRMMQPKIGGKKLYFMLKEPLKSLSIGRDKFFDILRANHLLIVPKRSYHVTTNSHHRFRKHKNMILDYQITKPNQVWVADITYWQQSESELSKPNNRCLFQENRRTSPCRQFEYGKQFDGIEESFEK